jgi:hypothetical protein
MLKCSLLDIRINFLAHMKRYISPIQTNCLILFKKIIAVFCENHMKHINTLCDQNAEFMNIKASVTYSNHWALQCVSRCSSVSV